MLSSVGTLFVVEATLKLNPIAKKQQNRIPTNNMTNSVNEIALALRDEITTCGVKFLDQSGFASGKAYTYLTSVELKEGDRVVVKANGRFAICEVIRYDGDAPIIDDNHEYQFIVQKIDTTQSQLAQDEYNGLKAEIRRRMMKARRRQIKEQILLGNDELKSLCRIESAE